MKWFEKVALTIWVTLIILVLISALDTEDLDEMCNTDNVTFVRLNGTWTCTDLIHNYVHYNESVRNVDLNEWNLSTDDMLLINGSRVCTEDNGLCVSAGNLSGSGVSNYIAKWTGASTLGLSSLQDDGSTLTSGVSAITMPAGGFHIGSSTTNHGAGDSVGIGVACRATGAYAFCFGRYADATNTQSTAVGDVALATGGASSAYGRYARATGTYAVAVGAESYAQSTSSVALSYQANAGDHDISIGQQATCTAGYGVCIGYLSSSTVSSNGVAIGNSAECTQSNCFAMGYDALAAFVAVAIGSESKANESFTIAIGNKAVSDFPGAVSIGQYATSSSSNSVAIGWNSTATDVNAIAIGSQAQATGYFSMAQGREAKATNLNSYAFGTQAQALENLSMTFGPTVNSEFNTTLFSNTVRSIGHFRPGECDGTLTEGDICYNTTIHKLYYYNSTNLVEV